MSLLSWFSPKKVQRAPLPPETSGLKADATRPVHPKGSAAAAKAAVADAEHAGNRKGERMARRELLYSVVRETMVRAGFLSSSYKFKVLSLDQRGRQFLVMVDLSGRQGSDTLRLAEIEAMIAQSAKARYDILVTAIYWRTNEHVAVGQPAQAGFSQSSPAPLDSGPMPLESPSRPAPLTAAPSRPAPLESGMPPRKASPRFEPLQDDEVKAFKKALAAAAAAGLPTVAAHAASKDADPKGGPRSYTLLTGYEDTEMPEQDLRSPALSATQYGDLH
ncbi:MAG: hypothetical protein ABW051_06900 [Burkholderiaceae bacterium]